MTIAEFLSHPIEYRDGDIYVNGEVFAYNEIPDYVVEGIKLIGESIRPRIVLEAGFGFGLTSDEFQRLNLQQHIIVEPHPDIFKLAEAWASNKDNVILVRDFINNVRDYDVDLVFDDHDMLDDEGYLNLSNITYRRFAQRATLSYREPQNLEQGFIFSYNNSNYFQLLKSNV